MPLYRQGICTGWSAAHGPGHAQHFEGHAGWARLHGAVPTAWAPNCRTVAVSRQNVDGKRRLFQHEPPLATCSMALGFLFLGTGTLTFGTSPEAGELGSGVALAAPAQATRRPPVHLLRRTAPLTSLHLCLRRTAPLISLHLCLRSPPPRCSGCSGRPGHRPLPPHAGLHHRPPLPPAGL